MTSGAICAVRVLGVIPKKHLVVRCIVQAVGIGIKHFLKLQYKRILINAESQRFLKKRDCEVPK